MLKDFTKEKFDVIIQAGQSNAEGYGFGSTNSPFENDGRVWALNANDTISLAAETVAVNSPRTDFSLSFAREYLKSGRLKEGRKLLIIRAAVGGTGFLDGHWGPEDDLRLKMHDMIKTALTLNAENRLVALLWHQGEQDAVQNASFETHYGHLMTLVNDVRTAFSAPSLLYCRRFR
ncbi:MAG: hypothetical protein IJS90_04365 [Clostridia bacterium]|nr:hypothetical protein [Clostridia bacterium]